MLSFLSSKFRRITTNQLYLPEIDGIRFLAIVIVVLFHTHGYFMAKSPLQFTDVAAGYPLFNSLLKNGGRGVELFFVLSGFILCLPFAHQYINGGKKIQLGRYYLRRVTRLEPPYIIALTGILIMQLIMHALPASTLIPSWAASLVYMHVIIYHHTPLLTVVAWSLEIEIQFYLLAPLLFRILALSRATRRYVLIALMLAFIIAQHYYTPSFSNIYEFAQFFFVGMLLADFYVSDTAAKLFNKPWMAWLALPVLAAILYWPFREQPATQFTFFAQLTFPFLIGLFYYIVLKNSAVKKIFSYGFIPIIGGMCYSIYLLHYTIISLAGRFTMRLHLTDGYLPNLLLQFLLIGIPVLIVSAIFYYFVERPFMAGKWTDMLIRKNKKQDPVNTVQQENEV